MPNRSKAVLTLRWLSIISVGYIEVNPAVNFFHSFAQFAKYLHSRQNLNSQLQPVQLGPFITLTDSDYDPKVKMNVFLDLLPLFTGQLIHLCIRTVFTSKAIYAPQTKSVG